MNLRWPGLVNAAFAATSICVFAAGGHIAATALIDSQRARQLQELNDVALRRAENAVDYAIIALGDLAERGQVACDAPTLQAVRLHVYQRGVVKDIRVVRPDGSVRCSAYSETLEFDKSWASRDNMLPGRNTSYHFFRVEQFFGTALGVMMDIDDHDGLVAIVGITGFRFDIMPDALRGHSDVELALRDGQLITHSSSHKPDAGTEDMVSVAAISARYPLCTTIRVEKAAFAAWNREPYLPIMALSALLGLAFGLLLGRAAMGPGGPVAELDRALAAGEFEPYLQPVFGLESGSIVGAEVLARWVRADGTVLQPPRFIQLAVETGRIETMTWQVIGKALERLQPRLKQDKTFRISFNIDPRHFVAPGFVDDLRAIVAGARVSPRQIVLELTEREGFEDLAQAAAVVAKLRDYGFKVAIDDVGIGHSGLSHIQGLGANILKIDKFFVDSIDRDTTANAVIEMLVRLAKELDMTIVAEGIEEQEQIAALRACGVVDGQGYLVSPPLPVDDFFALLDGQASTIDKPRKVRAA